MDTLTTHRLANAASRDITRQLREDIPDVYDAAARAHKRGLIAMLSLLAYPVLLLVVVVILFVFPDSIAYSDPFAYVILAVTLGHTCFAFWNMTFFYKKLHTLEKHAESTYGVEVIGFDINQQARVETAPNRAQHLHPTFTETRALLGGD